MINSIANIEVSSICDNLCPYCPSPTQSKYRDTGFMDMDTFKKSIEWVKELVDRGTQKELNLFGIGEPLLNPRIIEMIQYARKSLPLRVPLHLNTNGNVLTQDIAHKLKKAGIDSIHITDHKASSTVKAIDILTHAGIKFKVNRDAVYHPNSWAGQVAWPDCGIRFRCHWLLDKVAMIYWNGDVTACCIDSRGEGIFANVYTDTPQNSDSKKFSLCSTCHHDIGEA
jgi:hypothetical protein